MPGNRNRSYVGRRSIRTGGWGEDILVGGREDRREDILVGGREDRREKGGDDHTSICTLLRGTIMLRGDHGRTMCCARA